MNGTVDLRTAWSSRSFAGEVVIDGRADPGSAWDAAVGRTMAGGRTSLELDGRGLGRIAGTLGDDLAARAPLVIRVLCAHDHDALHAAGRAGVVVLAARSVQEACDLDLAARRIAERALVPVVVACDVGPGWAGEVTLPNQAVCARCVGAPADRIAAVGPAQRTAFGATRRRLPRFVDLDGRASVGATRPPRLGRAASAAVTLFGRDGLAEIVSEALDAVAAATGRALAPVVAERVVKGEGLVVTAGASAHAAAVHRWSVASIVLLSPFPETALRAELAQAARVVVLERGRLPADGLPGLAERVEALLGGRTGGGSKPGGLFRRRDASGPALCAGLVGPAPEEPRRADVEAFLERVARGEAGDAPVLVGLSFRPEGESLPKRRAMLDAVLRERPELAMRGVRAAEGERTPSTPAAPRHRPDVPRQAFGAAVDHRSRAGYFDRVGILEALGRGDDVLPDPFLALPSVPAATAALRPVGVAGLPAFDAGLCDGCGACWSLCPQAAIRPAANTARGLVDFALEAGRRGGGSTDVLRPLAGRLAARFRPARDLGASIRTAGDELLARGNFDAERRSAVGSALSAAADAVTGVALPSAVPGSFGDECLALGLDPEACNACGVCVAVCAPGALREAHPADPERTAGAHAAWARFLELPSTPAASLDRLGEVLGAAARLGFRDATLQPLVAGDTSPAGSGPRLALRLTLGAVAAATAPKVAAFHQRVETLRAQIGARIREVLADALPDADLDALSSGLQGLGDGDVPLAELAERVGDACDRGVVHAGTVGHLAEIGRKLADLLASLEGGQERAGRAPGALLVTPGGTFDWAVTEPWNPLTWPAARGPVGLADGLLEGLADVADEDEALLARAEAVLRGPKRIHAAVRAGLDEAVHGRADGSTDAAPLVVVGSAEQLADVHVGATLRLLRSAKPVVVLAVATDAEAPAPDWIAAACPTAGYHAILDLAQADALVAAVHRGVAAGRATFVHVAAPTPLALRPPVPAEPAPEERTPVPAEAAPVPAPAPVEAEPRLEDVAAVLRDRLADLALQGIARLREDP